jgi:glutaredoxin
MGEPPDRDSDAAAGGIVVYWQPGCTSCLKTKEFLRSHGIDFRSVNVREDPGAREALARLGARAVPVVARGDRFVLGQDLDEVARFVGVQDDRVRLPPPELAARLLGLLDIAARLTRLIPEAQLHTALPGRQRTYLDLAYHVPMIVAALLDASCGGQLTFEHFNRKPPESVRSADDAARVTESLARAFAQWWGSNAGSLPERLDTYYGAQPYAAVLERTTWHVAQHVRQIERVLILLNVVIERPVAPSVLAGLPLPVDVWDNEVRLE